MSVLGRTLTKMMGRVYEHILRLPRLIVDNRRLRSHGHGKVVICDLGTKKDIAGKPEMVR